MSTILKSSVTAKTFAVVAGVAMAFTFAFAPVSSVQAASLTDDQVQSILSLLESFGADSATISNVNSALTGSPVSGGGSITSSCDYVFTQDLTMGADSAEVMQVQKFLNNQGFNVASTGAGSPGMETTYFGSLTAAAVTAFQNAYASSILAPVGLTSGTGYWGPSTRAMANMLCQDDGDDADDDDMDDVDDGDLEGGAGFIEDADFLSKLSNEEVGEGDNDVEVAGLEIEADDGSDIELLAVTLDFELTSSDSGDNTNFDRYADEVSIWLDGEKLAEIDADEFTRSNDFEKSISLDQGGIIRRGDSADLVIAISAVSNLDSNDEGNEWDIAFSSIRFRDAQGAIITENTQGDIGTETRTFSFEDFASAADLELRIKKGDDSVNDSRPIKVDADDDTQGEDVFSFMLEVEGDSDILIEDFPVFFETGTADVDDVLTSVEMFVDGSSVGSVNVGSSEWASSGTSATSTFEDMDLEIRAGDVVEVIIEVDFAALDGVAYAEGETLTVTVGEVQTDSDEFYAEDEQGNVLSDDEVTGSRSSEAHTLSLSGIELSAIDSKESTNEDDSVGYIAWNFTLEATDETLEFDVADNDAVDGSSDDVRFTVLGTDVTIAVTSLTLISGDATFAGGTWTIEEGDEAKFALDTTLTTVDAGDDGTYRVRLDSIAGIKVDETSGSVNLAN